MRILYLIGNGFDLNLGLKTSYADFYEHYLSRKSADSETEKFKEYIKSLRENKDDTLWSDLELALGHSTEAFDDPEILANTYTDVNISLGAYIRSQDKRINPTEANCKLFQSYLLNPIQYLTDRDKLLFQQFSRGQSNDWEISFMIFNYTHSIEALLYSKASIELGKNYLGGNTQTSTIEHIHGECDKTILLGVNDPSQIENQKFRNNRRILRRLVKPKSNDEMGNLKMENCFSLLTNSDLIISFGLSFGKTDAMWWEKIAEILRNPYKRLIIFDKPDILADDIEHNAFIIGDNKQIMVQKIIGAQDSRENKIYYAMSTKMFSDLGSCVI